MEKVLLKSKVAAIGMGGSYGILLGTIAFFCAGLGHGTYIPAAVSSAPLGFAGVPAALFTSPLVWASLAGLAMQRGQVFKVAIGVHYVGAVSLVATDYHADWSYVSKVPEMFLLYVAFYVIGQVLIWRVHRRGSLAFWTEFHASSGGRQE